MSKHNRKKRPPVEQRLKDMRRQRYLEANDALAARSLLMMALNDEPGWRDRAREFLNL